MRSSVEHVRKEGRKEGSRRAASLASHKKEKRPGPTALPAHGFLYFCFPKGKSDARCHVTRAPTNSAISFCGGKVAQRRSKFQLPSPSPSSSSSDCFLSTGRAAPPTQPPPRPPPSARSSEPQVGGARFGALPRRRRRVRVRVEAQLGSPPWCGVGPDLGFTVQQQQGEVAAPAAREPGDEAA
ncbi:hypothetical protein ZWY2020_019225 [Hordeum vulgare]|nr:hypothetical protein ZWY2020_019225 [Hordeum vulgare]